MQSGERASSARRFDHPALFYTDPHDYLATTVPFIQKALGAGEPVMVAVPTANLARLCKALGEDAHRIAMHDMSVAGRNPGRIIGDVLLTFASKHPGRRPHIIGEPIWPGRDSIEYPACAQHEALINPAFAGRDAVILCPYNTTHLDPLVVDDALRTHPVVWTSSLQYYSDRYGDPLVTADSFNVPLGVRPETAESLRITPEVVAESRRFSASFALAVGLPVDRVADAVVAVDELVNNTIEHGSGRGWLAAWTEHSRAVYEVVDSNHIDDPLAGRRPITDDSAVGRGLALVHRHSDLVRIHTTARGTTVRAYFELTEDLDENMV